MSDDNLIVIPNSFRPTYTIDPAVSFERKILITPRVSQHTKNIEMYETFDKELREYISKIPNESIRSIIIDLLNKNMIYLGRLTMHQSGITGTLLINTNTKELIAVVVEMNNLEIDHVYATMTRVSDTVYTIYQQYIRATVLSNSSLIVKDDELINLVEKYFNYLMIKILKLSYLNDKQRILFDVTTSTFFLTYYLNINANIALERSMNKYCPDKFKEEISNIITADRMKRYIKFNDLFNAYYDNKAILDDPNNNVRRFLQGLRLYGYMFVSSTFDYLISTACASKYNFSVIISCAVDNKLQSHIEDIIIKKYSSKVKYDSNAVKYLSMKS